MKNLTRNLLITIILVLPIFLPAKSISLEDAKVIAKEQNLILKQQKLAHQAVKNSYLNSFLSYGPNASFTTGYSKSDPTISNQLGEEIENSKNYGFSVSQPIINGGKIIFGNMIAKDNLKISEINLRQTEQIVETEVETKFFAILKAIDQKSSTEKNLSSSQINLDKSKIRMQSGDLSQADFWNLQATHYELEAQFYQQEGEVNNAKLDLQNYLEMKESIEIIRPHDNYLTNEINELAKITEAQFEHISQDLLNFAMKKSPTISQNNELKAISKKQLYLSMGEVLPKINLSYNKNWSKNNLDDDYAESGSIGVNLSVPIFPIVNNTIDIHTAKTNLKKQEYANLEANNELVLNVKKILTSIRVTAKRVKAMNSAKKFAEKSYNEMQIRYDNNFSSTADLLSSESSKISAQTNYFSAIYDYRNFQNQLRVLIGANETDIMDLLSIKRN